MVGLHGMVLKIFKHFTEFLGGIHVKFSEKYAIQIF